ncbi:MAG: class I SAM-dependent methyltransferase [Myxococcota bacterium]|nr:class I SAM-dependent methyltransferase [Myxococcota bacterium]
MAEVLDRLRRGLESTGGLVSCDILNPDLKPDLFDGEMLTQGGITYTYRSLKCWLDIAETLGCRMGVPIMVSDTHLRLRFTTLADSSSWHTGSKPSGDTEKYGTQSQFYRIHRFEDPHFVNGLKSVLGQINLAPGARILILGVNRGDEIAGIRNLVHESVRDTLDWVGIDHCATALEQADSRFSHLNVRLLCHSISELQALDLGRFSLVVAINTLHSPSVDGQAICRRIVKSHLTPDGTIILGFPNCRYHGGVVVYGARVPNYRRPEYSLLFRQVSGFRRYLNQQGFKTTLTGKYTLQLAATRTNATS